MCARTRREKSRSTVDDLGTPELKNIAQPIRVFRVRLGVPERPAAAAPRKTVPRRPAVPEHERRSRAGIFRRRRGGGHHHRPVAHRWLFVIARNSSFAYKGKSPDIRAVGRELGVRYVLEGSIRRSTNRIRITCQLIEAATGGHVWADRFDGEMEDIFDLQDHITEAVVGAIEPSLKRAEIARATAKPTERLDAYDLYLRAWPYYNASGREASDHCDCSAPTRAGDRSDICAREGALGERLCHARRTAILFAATERSELHWRAKSLKSDSDDPEVLRRVGFAMSQLLGDFPAAFTALNRALRLHPNSVLVFEIGWRGCIATPTIRNLPSHIGSARCD